MICLYLEYLFMENLVLDTACQRDSSYRLYNYRQVSLKH
jgi:hypothetical protein